MSQSRMEPAQNPRVGRNSLTLQTRLVLFVLFISLVPLILIATRDILQTRQALTNGAEISLKSNALQTANSLDNFIQATLDSVDIESQFVDFKTYLTLSIYSRPGPTETRALDLLNKLSQKGDENIISYALIDTNGNVLLDSVSSNIRKNESSEAYFPQVQFNNQPIVTAVTYSDNSTPTLTFANKVIDDRGGFIGILRVKYKSAVLQDVISKSVGPTTDTLILLLDEFHIRMADSQNPSLIQKSITPLNQVDYLLAIDTKRFLDIPREKQSTNFVEFDNALDTAEEKPFFRVDITPNIPGDDTVAVALLKTKPWTVAYTRPTSIFLADVQQQIRTNIILVISTSIFITLLAALVARSLAGPIISLTNTANSISQGDLSARAEVRTSDEIGILASAFNSMTSQLQTTLAGLEERIGERTKDLQKSNLELETIAEVAREISIIRDLDTLLKVSTNLIRERLNYYHVGIFIVDDRNEYAHLQAASSIASEQMLSQNIKFRIDGMDPLATALRSGNVYFSPDAGKDKFLPRNSLLPDTVSEALLPLHIRNITIGALDIHAGAGVPFGERETNTLRLLADQMAAAVENAQLVRQVEGTLRELTNASRSQTRQIWKAAINQKEQPGYEYDGLRIKPVPQNLSKDLLRQLESGKPIIVTRETGDVNNSLLLPLTVLNQVIGVIGLENEDPNHIWSENDIAIAQAATNRASLTLENARLLEESQRRATKERAISDATSRIGSAVNMENILLATAEELERILGDSELILQINTSTTSSKKD